LEYVLEMLDITKQFPGVLALDKARLRVRKATVHALMGENGAGKSTLMKCLFGIYKPDGGKIILEGKEVSITGPKNAMDLGVAMVHQELSQVTKRSVMENIWLGRYPKNGFIVDERRMYEDTKALLSELEIDVDPREILENLSVAKRQMIEIAKAVSLGAKILVLDEPTSSLTVSEVEHLFSIINKLRGKGCAIIYISHKMDEILRISDEVSIMRDGQYISTDRAMDLSVEQIIHKMVGRRLENMYPPYEYAVTDELLRVENLSLPDGRLKNVSFSLKKGEILGLAGLVGSGRSEVLESVFGMMDDSVGRVLLNCKEIPMRHPKYAIKEGFALVTEERRANGIFSRLSILDNMCISNLDSYKSPLMLLSDPEMEKDASYYKDALKIKAPNLSTPIGKLSGGNQQKVIFGRWMLTKPTVMMLDEPTRGIDVLAKYEIYELICKMKKRGIGIILVSSEMPELIGMCDRIIVMSGGRVAGQVDRSQFSDPDVQEHIMTMAAKYV